ncbi:transglycosylase SLT domain-containing protein [Streptomyces sp. LBUM 1478]|uniref:Putative membrane protein n=1 Tax=Streptomyces scabiei (strain 87.22) TaxID=680198 RepID=C9YZW5_STRSW|nr:MULTISPECIES: transglycosylase SLT domain-containing protein [Streptomyces]MBP5864556.1 transglycosylase SLT domain-containing protein [Streptomyces sp. LBUM 1484]MBP5866512.1 transglycosylase SLT domain-containing protein [Streptomyces sp. LBUM 1485]MBP5905203.1 transglycosylase SLT domain-containing protein [Streptomyces sp. LBUM 1478]MBP5932495.1 transglycosylase SLT domain-containing protein [Streptomyces sp. LBUM 1479]MBP5874788.1 transglycosylase SLT domain-containing protein [Strepto
MIKNAKNPGHSLALTKTHKLSLAGVATFGVAALAFSLVPAEAQTATQTVSAAPAAFSQNPAQAAKVSVTNQAADADKKAAVAAAQKKAAQERAKKEAASRAAQRAKIAKAAAKSYPDNLDGWIREALDIMKKHKIPGTYHGLHKNIMRESSGNPRAINNWDINAQNGVPSIGLLQVIKPTFDTYHVPGTAKSQYDPVANLTAAANYAAHRYGSIDNVNSAY